MTPFYEAKHHKISLQGEISAMEWRSQISVVGFGCLFVFPEVKYVLSLIDLTGKDI